MRQPSQGSDLLERYRAGLGKRAPWLAHRGWTGDESGPDATQLALARSLSSLLSAPANTDHGTGSP